MAGILEGMADESVLIFRLALIVRGVGAVVRGVDDFDDDLLVEQVGRVRHIIGLEPSSGAERAHGGRALAALVVGLARHHPKLRLPLDRVIVDAFGGACSRAVAGQRGIFVQLIAVILRQLDQARRVAARRLARRLKVPVPPGPLARKVAEALFEFGHMVAVA